jgi:PIN domain nuclease of toxin-antitoxin system
MIVLDTHPLIWWASGDKGQLSALALAAIERELDGGQVFVSSISAWELSMLVANGRLALSMAVAAWLPCVGSIELPGEFHKDPADRLIVATARKLAAALVTADEKIRASPHVRTLW